MKTITQLLIAFLFVSCTDTNKDNIQVIQQCFDDLYIKDNVIDVWNIDSFIIETYYENDPDSYTKQISYNGWLEFKEDCTIEKNGFTLADYSNMKKESFSIIFEQETRCTSFINENAFTFSFILFPPGDSAYVNKNTYYLSK